MRLIATLLVLACDPAPISGVGHVLFVGNSLTFANDLPGMVSALADSGGIGPVITESITVPNFSLADHLDQGSAVAAIRRDRWDYVILQQGPSSLEESRADLIESAGRFNLEIRRANSRTALYSVWPETARLNVFDQVSESYRLAAASAKGIYLPAGEAWRAAWRRDSTQELYDTDGFHPSVRGTYLAALVIYARISGRPAVGLPARFRTSLGLLVDIPAATALLLQDAADEANRTNPKEP